MTTNWIYLHYWLSVTLFLVGIYGMLIKPNLIRKLMAMNILQVAVIIFFITIAVKDQATVPIAQSHNQPTLSSHYINPLPHALMLTAIVVSISTTGVALALAVRIHRRYGTLEETELLSKLRE